MSFLWWAGSWVLVVRVGGEKVWEKGLYFEYGSGKIGVTKLQGI